MLRAQAMSQPAFSPLTDQLLATTGASRITIRVRDGRGDYPIVAEAVAPGVPSLLGGEGVGDLRAAATFQYLERERCLLVQEDLEHADPAPPAALIHAYGARAQMLAPVLDGDEIVAIVSVHQSGGPRAWTPEDVRAIEDAAAEVARRL